MIKLVFSKNSFYIEDIKNLTKSLESFIHTQTIEKYRKRGIVVGISGGIDSAVVASLASNAVGKENILGLILQEKESNSVSQELAKKLCKN